MVLQNIFATSQRSLQIAITFSLCCLSTFQMKLIQLRTFADMVEQIYIEKSKMALDLDDAPDEFRGEE